MPSILDVLIWIILFSGVLMLISALIVDSKIKKNRKEENIFINSLKEKIQVVIEELEILVRNRLNKIESNHVAMKYERVREMHKEMYVNTSQFMDDLNDSKDVIFETIKDKNIQTQIVNLTFFLKSLEEIIAAQYVLDEELDNTLNKLLNNLDGGTSQKYEI